MKSVAPTKIINWLKKPRSLIANVGIVVAAVAVVSVPVVSAYAITTSNNENTEIQTSAADTAKESSDVAKETTEPVAKTEAEATDTTTTEQNSASTAAPAAQTPKTTTPAAPQPKQYTDTYPADLKNAPISSKFDQWGLDNRQSTSYTAWKVSEAGKNMPKWGYTGKGDASSWPTNADNAGISRGATPVIGSVGVSGNFTVYVEAVNGDKIDVSFYNWNSSGTFGYWNDISASQFATYIYF